MAGIGFVIRNLVQKDHRAGILSGYLSSALLTAGPWLFTILALGGITLFGQNFSALKDIEIFRLCIVYNFSVSLALSGPLTIIVTRYIADKIYKKDVREVPGVLIGSLGVSYLIQIPLVVGFYFFYIKLPPEIKLAAVTNFFLISGIWQASVFLAVLKDYTTISTTFGVGMMAGILASFFLGEGNSQSEIFWGFNIGLGFIFFILTAKILAEYPYKVIRLFGFMEYFRKYWELALCGLFFNLTIWADKWIMWFSPHRQSMANGFVSYPIYDSAMFLAFLTLIPSMVIFSVNIEPTFFKKYVHYFKEIKNHATYDTISKNQEGMMHNLFYSFCKLILVQGTISLMAVFFAPKIFEWFNINFLLMEIFRLGVVGAFFHILSMFVFIILYYFDFRKPAMGLSFLFLALNITFTLATFKMGFPFYGYGYFLSSAITFAAACGLAYHYLRTLLYSTFIRNNPSLT